MFFSWNNVSQKSQEVEICLRLNIYCRRKSCRMNLRPHYIVRGSITRSFSFRSSTTRFVRNTSHSMQYFNNFTT